MAEKVRFTEICAQTREALEAAGEDVRAGVRGAVDAACEAAAASKTDPVGTFQKVLRKHAPDGFDLGPLIRAHAAEVGYRGPNWATATDEDGTPVALKTIVETLRG